VFQSETVDKQARSAGSGICLTAESLNQAHYVASDQHCTMLRSRQQQRVPDGGDAAARLVSLSQENQRLRELVRGGIALTDPNSSSQRPNLISACMCWAPLLISGTPFKPLQYPPTILLPAMPAQVAEHASAGASVSGYLWKYRPHATASLWANTWELRYFVLRGSTLTYFKSEQDVLYPPRGQIELHGTFVEAEGLKRRKYHTFQVGDKRDAMLMRVSTEKLSEYQRWMDALERAGCTRVSWGGMPAIPTHTVLHTST
jgi:hypothetical protein